MRDLFLKGSEKMSRHDSFDSFSKHNQDQSSRSDQPYNPFGLPNGGVSNPTKPFGPLKSGGSNLTNPFAHQIGKKAIPSYLAQPIARLEISCNLT